MCEIICEVASMIALVMLSGLPVLFLWAVCQALWYNRPPESADEQRLQAGVLHERLRLKNMAYWFSEDIPTMRLLQDLGDGLGVDTARERWRAARQKHQHTP